MQITSLRAGKRARVMPCATISASQRIGAPARERAARGGDEVRAEHDVLRRLDRAAGMDHAHRDLGLFGGKARQVGLGADDGERALIDRRAVAQIGRALRHGSASRFCVARVSLRSRPAVHPLQRSRTECRAREPSAISAHPSAAPTTVSAARLGMRAALGAAGNVDGERRRRDAARPLRRCAARWRARRCAPTSRSARRRRR